MNKELTISVPNSIQAIANNLIPSEKLPDTLILLSHSNDSLLDYCARKFEFRQLYKKIPPAEALEPESMALRVGTIMHEAAQAWLRARHLGFENPLDVAFYTLAMHWDYRNEETTRPLGAAVVLLEKMAADSFWNDWDICEIEGFGPAIEVPFRIMHPHIKLPAGYSIATQGKVDVIMQNRRTGEIRPIDFKTTTQPEETWKPLFRFSDQAAFYGFPVQAIQGIPIASEMSVTYYMLSFSRPISTAKDSAEQLNSGELSQDFLRVRALTFTYSTEELREMIDTKWKRLESVAGFIQNDMFPRRTHGCVVYNRPCSFFGVCHIRDRSQLQKWFAFEEWGENDRVYLPVWTFTS